VVAINILPQLYVTEPRRRQLNTTNAINYAKFFSRSHNTVIRVYDEAGDVIETHEQAGDFKEP
jgi:hypothetical protein